MKKAYFIFNLQAGRQPVKVVKSSMGGDLADIIDKFTKAGYEVTCRPTQNQGDAISSAEYACLSGFDILICAGGDGTLSECIDGLMNCENRIPVGYIPLGTTNDFAKGLGVPDKTLDACDWVINGLENNTTVSCDIGSINSKHFAYISAFGAFTSVTYETPQYLKNIFGHTAYIFNGLSHITNIKGYNMRIEYDDVILEEEFAFGMVTNSKKVAGLFPCSNFLLDDGVYEVTLVKKPTNVIHLQQLMLSMFNGTQDIDDKYIKSFKTSKITFTCLDDEMVSWTTDGEFGGKDRVNVVLNNNKAVDFIVGSYDKNNFLYLK